MLFISDGKLHDDANAKAAAAAAKADGVTIFAFGFNTAQASSMEEISGNELDTCGSNCSLKADGGLDQLINHIEQDLCQTIITIVPPTPAPTKACTVNPKDDEWIGCQGDLCKYFPYNDGRSALCIQQEQAGACSDPLNPFHTFCSCTCGRCCTPTPQPTPAPSNPPTPAPTYADCIAEFDLQLPARSNWLTARQYLEDLFTQCNYNFDSTWLQEVNDARVWIVKNNTTYAFDGPEGIAKEPYEALSLQICMPVDFASRQISVPTCLTGGGVPMPSSANPMLGQALLPACLLLLLFVTTQ